MKAIDDGIVLGAHADPDVVEIDLASEFAEDGRSSTTWVESGGISVRATLLVSSGGGVT